MQRSYYNWFAFRPKPPEGIDEGPVVIIRQKAQKSTKRVEGAWDVVRMWVRSNRYTVYEGDCTVISQHHLLEETVGKNMLRGYKELCNGYIFHSTPSITALTRGPP